MNTTEQQKEVTFQYSQHECTYVKEKKAGPKKKKVMLLFY